jgi:hypothetical protein
VLLAPHVADAPIVGATPGSGPLVAEIAEGAVEVLAVRSRRLRDRLCAYG